MQKEENLNNHGPWWKKMKQYGLKSSIQKKHEGSREKNLKKFNSKINRFFLQLITRGHKNQT